MAICLVGLGSNLPDRVGFLTRVDFLTQALAALASRPGIRLLRSSSFVETKPVGGPPGQGNYLNAAALVETELPPAELLSELLTIEKQLGRVRSERWGPRTIDLDLLLYDQTVLDTSELTLPHPRLAERRFVLDPAAEIAPDLVHRPSGLTIRQLLNRLPTDSGETLGLRIFTSPVEMQAAVLRWRSAGQRVAVVPTMGALHEGHISLVRAARERADVVVATIFVNPTQFAPHEDFAKYPRTLEADLAALASAGCDVVFVPQHEAIYPPGFSTYVEPSAVALPLEGVCRPGHFRGVATVVLKLFQLIPAHVACFGQKDYQQVRVIEQMVADLNVPIEIIVCPTVREPDGLALSSRNRYLSPAERQQALALSRALDQAERLVTAGESNCGKIVSSMRNTLTQAGIEKIDYVALADPQTLAELSQLTGPAVALIACFVGTTRLIDNRILRGRSSQ